MRLGAAASLEDGVGALPELEVLELRRCPRVAGSGLDALSHHRSLRRVALRECGGANASGLLRGLTPLHQLQVRDKHRWIFLVHIPSISPPYLKSWSNS